MNERDWRGGWVIATQMKNNRMCDITKLGKRIEEKLQMMISKIDCQKTDKKEREIQNWLCRILSCPWKI